MISHVAAIVLIAVGFILILRQIEERFSKRAVARGWVIVSVPLFLSELGHSEFFAAVWFLIFAVNLREWLNS